MKKIALCACVLLLHLSMTLVMCLGMLGLSQLNFGHWIWCGFAIFKRRDNRLSQFIAFGIVSRAILVGVGFVILSQTASNSPGDKERILLGVAGGVLLSLMALDWRCFAAPHRHHRILIRPTIVAGLTALFGSLIVLGESRCEIISAAFAMSLALGLQLVAPLRRAKAISKHDISDVPTHHEEKTPMPQIRLEETQEVVR